MSFYGYYHTESEWPHFFLDVANQSGVPVGQILLVSSGLLISSEVELVLVEHRSVGEIWSHSGWKSHRSHNTETYEVARCHKLMWVKLAVNALSSVWCEMLIYGDALLSWPFFLGPNRAGNAVDLVLERGNENFCTVISSFFLCLQPARSVKQCSP